MKLLIKKLVSPFVFFYALAVAALMIVRDDDKEERKDVPEW